MRAAALLVLLVGCGSADARDGAWEQHAAKLSGEWIVRFTYARDHAAVAGTMDLMPNHTIDRSYPRIGVPTNYGTYAIGFRDLGGPPSGNRVPAVVAGFVSDDSVHLSFETDRETFTMQMHGALSGDSLRGTWIASQSRGTIASGTFSMTRK